MMILSLLLSCACCVVGYVVGRADAAWERIHGAHQELDHIDLLRLIPVRDELAERRRRRGTAA
jgi:hypothetical protein